MNPPHGQFVDPIDLKTLEHLNKINIWTEIQQTTISERKKNKSIIVNFTERFQFHTRLQIKNKNVEIVEKTKVMGTILTNALS